MSIPKYNEMFTEFLNCLKDKEVSKSIKDIRVELIKQFSISDEDLLQMLPSNTQTVFDNRSAWTSFYLKKAGLITAVQRGVFQITDEGLKVLAEHSKVDDSVLRKFDSFKEFLKGNSDKSSSGESPLEEIERLQKEINDPVRDELLSEIKKMNPYQFERLALQLLLKMGYGEATFSETTKKSCDEGIDGIVTSDKFGFDAIYVQVKRYKDHPVSRPEIQKFIGAIAGHPGASKGIFITASTYSKDAIEYVKKYMQIKLILIDGEQFANYMLEYDLGVSTEQVYKVKRIDSDFFSDFK